MVCESDLGEYNDIYSYATIGNERSDYGKFDNIYYDYVFLADHKLMIFISLDEDIDLGKGITGNEKGFIYYTKDYEILTPQFLLQATEQIKERILINK